MQLDIYCDISGLTKIGEIEILYDRITKSEFKIPVRHGNQNQKVERSIKRYPATSVRKFKTFWLENPCSFILAKLSKADMPYTKLKLTHELISPGLRAIGDYRYFTKLTLLQKLKVDYNTGHCFWQAAEFKQKVYQSTVGYIIPVLIGALGSVYLLTFGRCNSTINLNKKDSTVNQFRYDSATHRSLLTK